MRAICAMDTVQIECCNVCWKHCGNCSRFCSLVREPYFMGFDEFKRAVDSMVGYNAMTGIQGGDPLLHPDFEKMCKYAAEKIPKKQLGLWTALPPGKEHYAELICDTFEHVFFNSHDGPTIYHQSALVALQEVHKNPKIQFLHADRCWVQEAWSASINPRGAWFCEIAASLSMLFEEGEGWPVEPEWWTRTPKDFTSQIEQFCPRCGFAVKTDLRDSNEPYDDISPLNYEALKDKVRHPERLKIYSPVESCKEQPQMAAYKDTEYRNSIAARYGMRLYVNEQGFWTPYMMKNKAYSFKPVNVIKEITERMAV